MSLDLILMVIVIVAGFYMAWNIGANDVANAMGTSVGSRALTLRQAVIIAAVLEFCGAFFFGSHVSETIQKGIIDPQSFAIQPLLLVYGMLACLIAAGLWLQIASYYGWPVSTTHTIVGAIIGFGVVVGGVDSVQWANVLYIVSSWVISPLSGGVLAFLIFSMLKKVIFRAADPIKACKAITPFIVWVIVAVLMPVLLFSGSAKQFSPSFLEGLFLSIAAGALAAYLSFWLINHFFTRHVSPFHPSAAFNQLEEAQHALLQASNTLDAGIQDQLYRLTEDIDLLKNDLKAQIATARPEASEIHIFVEKIFGYLQISSACLMAFAHGANDVANAIGPLAAALAVLKTGSVAVEALIPTWVLGFGATGIVIGLATWGWRVIETIGRKITELTPTRGFAAEFATALTIVVASRLGMPVSTTHTLVGAVMGVGLAGGIGALNLGMAREIFISWMVTVPVGAGLAIFFFYLLQMIFQ